MVPKIFRAQPDIAGEGSDAGVGSGQLFVQATQGQVVLPDGFNPAEAAFERAGPDLMLVAPDGTEVLVADFFMMETPPDLLSPLGARVVGDLAVRLAGSVAPGMVAGELPAPGEAIGRVTDLNGEVTVIRVDGTRTTLQNGDAVLQGDILETGLEAGIGVLLADGTSLSMGQDARMVLDEMVYDPGTQEGNIALSVMKGIFTIVSGEVSKTDPEAMMVHTPVATIGIRGTQIGLDLSNGRDLNLVMMEEADGFVGEVMIINSAGVMTLNEAYFAVTVSSYDIPPVAAPTYTREAVAHTFGSALSLLPTGNANANDYGLRAGLEEPLSALEMEAEAEVPAEEAPVEEAPVEEAPGEEGLATFDAALGEEAPTEDVEGEGLADFETVVAETLTPTEEQPEAFIPSAGVELTADELAGEADVVFGEEIAPLEPTEAVTPPTSEQAPTTEEEPVEFATEEATTPVAEPEPEPEPENVAPVAEAGAMITAEDNVFSGQLVASDLEGGALTFGLAEDGGPSNGTVSVNPDGTFIYVPNIDFGGSDSFTYMVTDDAGAMAMATVKVTVTPVADVPQIAVADVSGFEDSAIALTIATAMSAGTAQTVASVTVSGIPAGAALSAGSDNGDGSWTLNPDQLTGLTLTPPPDFSGALDLNVSATSTDGGVASRDFALHVGPVADVPQLAVGDVSGAEDATIMLAIATAMPGGTSETVDSILLTGVPAGASLSAGVDNGDGTWTLTPGDLGGLTLSPPADYNGAFNIGVSVTSSDGGVSTDTFAVNVNPVADTPVVAAADVSGTEDGAIALTLAASMPTGTTETVDSLIVTGVPDGAVLSAGTDNGDGTWTLSPDQLSTLTLTPPTDYHGTLNLGVIATSTDGGTSSGGFAVTVEPLADVPQLAVADALGAEDGTIALTLAATMPSDTTEAVYTITIEGVPPGASLSAGMDNGDGSWTLTPDLMSGLTLTPPQDYSGTFDLNVVATSTDGGTAMSPLNVTVTPVADIPVVALTDASGAEDSAIALSIAASMSADTAETVDTIIVTGVPDGALLSAGTDNGDGTWTLTSGDLEGLTLTPPQDFNGTFNLGVSVTSTDGGVSSDTLAVNVGSVSDVPVIAVSDVSGAEDNAIALTVAANMPTGTGETLDSITISGVPDGAVLSAGTDNGDGTWNVTADDLAGLSLTPPTNYSGVISLSVTAVSSDGGTATSSFNAAVAPVADVPVLQVSDVVVSVETPPGAVIEGTSKADELYGTMGDDEIEGGAGHDVIYGDSDFVPGDDEKDDKGKDDKDDDKGKDDKGDDDKDDEHGRGHGRDDEDEEGGDEGGDEGPDAPEALVVPLDVNAALTDIDGSEALSIEISNVPDGALLSVGTDNGDGTWSLLADDLSHLDDLTMTLAAGSDLAAFELGVSATSSELESGETATATATIDVTFEGGEGGDDYIDGGAGNDEIYGGGGDDTILGGKGRDELYGEAGDDTLDGGAGRDEIYGGAGDDVIVGGKGRDELYGEAGDDTLDGGAGRDEIYGGAGDDTLVGGGGADEFIFHAGDGDDIVLDLSHKDVLRFEGQEFDMDDFILQSDSETDVTTITFGENAGVSVTLNDVYVEDTSSYTVTQDGDAIVVSFDKDSIE